MQSPMQRTQNSRLEKLFHSAHTHAWNGPEVVRQAARARADATIGYRDALGRFASAMMAVEEASWKCSLALAAALHSTEARLAATAQAADEANHYVTVREYLRDLDVPTSSLHPQLAVLLDRIEMATDAGEAFVMLHLTLENATTILFKRIAKSGADVVLSKVMPYYIRDESRHVTFAEVYLPELVSGATPQQLARWGASWAGAFGHVTAWLRDEADMLAAFGIVDSCVVEEMRDVEEELAVLAPPLIEALRMAHEASGLVARE